MERLWRWLVTGDAHNHKWKKTDEVDVYGNDSNGRPICKLIILQCEHCGDMKKFKITN